MLKKEGEHQDPNFVHRWIDKAPESCESRKASVNKAKSSADLLAQLPRPLGTRRRCVNAPLVEAASMHSRSLWIDTSFAQQNRACCGWHRGHVQFANQTMPGLFRGLIAHYRSAHIRLVHGLERLLPSIARSQLGLQEEQS